MDRAFVGAPRLTERTRPSRLFVMARGSASSAADVPVAGQVDVAHHAARIVIVPVALVVHARPFVLAIPPPSSGRSPH